MVVVVKLNCEENLVSFVTLTQLLLYRKSQPKRPSKKEGPKNDENKYDQTAKKTIRKVQT